MLVGLPNLLPSQPCLCDVQLLDGGAAAVWFVGGYFRATWSPVSAWPQGGVTDIKKEMKMDICLPVHLRR